MAFKHSSRKRSIKRLTLLAMLTALCYVSRSAFQFLPNVQPVTVILIILTLTLGITDGLIVATLSIFVSNLNLGMGIWTIAQIVSFALIVVATGLFIKPIYKKIPFFIMILYSVITGYAYGFFISAIQAPFFGIQNFWVYYFSGLSFDTLHAFGNGVFYLILAPILFPLLTKSIDTYYFHE